MMRRRPPRGRDNATPGLPFVALSDLLMTVLALITVYFLLLYASTQQKLHATQLTLNKTLTDLTETQNRLEGTQNKLAGTSRRTDSILAFQDQVARAVQRDLHDKIKVRVEGGDQQIFTFQGDVLFNPSSFNINDKPDAQALLTQFAISLAEAIKAALEADRDRAYPEIQIHGHTDGVAMQVRVNKDLVIDNWHLSALRALAVVGVLRHARCLPTEQMSAAGYSCHRPIVRVTGANAENRRIEIRLLYSLKSDKPNDSVKPFSCNCY